jgi:hypothetical protein
VANASIVTVQALKDSIALLNWRSRLVLFLNGNSAMLFPACADAEKPDTITRASFYGRSECMRDCDTRYRFATYYCASVAAVNRGEDYMQLISRRRVARAAVWTE